MAIISRWSRRSASHGVAPRGKAASKSWSPRRRRGLGSGVVGGGRPPPTRSALTTRGRRITDQVVVDAHLAVNGHERGDREGVAEARVQVVEALVKDLRPVVDEVER